MDKKNLERKIFSVEKKKSSTRAPIDYESKYPDGMKNFVKQWISKGWHTEIQNMCGPGKELYKENVDMRYVYYYNLIKKFLNTEFQDQTIYKSVKDLPEEEAYLAIDCLGCYLGMNPHNGNIHLLQIVKKFKDSLFPIPSQ